MKKTLIASAVAAAALSTNAFAMDPATDLAEKVDAMPTFYGNIQLAYIHTENDPAGGTKTSTNETIDNGSTFGIKHDHQISEGLTGFLKAEFHFDADDKGGANAGFQDGLDEAFIGVKTDMHSFQLGSDDTVYEWVDIMDYSEAVGPSLDLAGVDEGDNFQYVGNFGDLTVGATIKLDSDTNDSGALAATYALDNVEITGAYAMGREEGGAEKGDTVGVAATFSAGDLSVGGMYTQQGDSKTGNTKNEDATSAFGLIGKYTMGANQFVATYLMGEQDAATSAAEEEFTGLSLQALHNVSDNAYVYVEYALDHVETSDKSLDEDDTALAIGAAYYF